MEENEVLMVDFTKVVEYIKTATGYTDEVVNNVLDKENEYLEKLGIVETTVPSDNQI
jgi:hypothetical protein